MSRLWLLCLVGAVAGGVPPSDRANSPCEPGSVWTADDGCNTCFCLQNGVAGCTYIDCSARDPPADTMAAGVRGGETGLKPMPLPEPDEVVKSFTFYGEEAQEPVPLPLPEPQPRGAAAPSGDWQKPYPKPTEERSDVNCTAGEEWQEECNTCHCLGDGMAACTKVSCSSEGRALATAVRGRCEPGVTWSDACNVCHCVDASQVICSYRSCAGAASRRRRQADCTPGTSRRVGCNECRCTDTGREACTLKFCLRESLAQSGGSPSDRASPGDECAQRCPDDCGSHRREDGCLVCDCDSSRYSDARRPSPSQPDRSAASARSGDRSAATGSDSLPEPTPYDSGHRWGHSSDPRMERHSFGSRDRGVPHRHSAWGDVISDTDSASATSGFGFPEGSDRRDSAYGSYDDDYRDRFTSSATSDSGRFSSPRDRYPSRDSSTGRFSPSRDSFSSSDSFSGRFPPPRDSYPSSDGDSGRFSPSRGGSSDGFTSLGGFNGRSWTQFGAASSGTGSGRVPSSERFGSSSGRAPSSERFGSSSGRAPSSGRFGSSSGDRFGSSGSVSGNTLRFLDRRHPGAPDAGAGAGGFSARRGEERGSSTGRRGGESRGQSSWEAFTNWSSSLGHRARTADNDGWTSVGRK
ncbi:hornerin-like [Amphibalanus amphitrite]|uniref:hornerin-like n=1 Tax=Amphibalanus amphitrite TaxID=1232801 RepID=UPI001C919858|nr:hornerin-like [Amphibalanus amphitrite]